SRRAEAPNADAGRHRRGARRTLATWGLPARTRRRRRSGPQLVAKHCFGFAPTDRVTLAALDVELGPHDADRVGGVVEVKLAAALTASQRILLVLAHEAAHRARHRLALRQRRLPSYLVVPIQVLGAIDITHQHVGADENRTAMTKARLDRVGNLSRDRALDF